DVVTGLGEVGGHFAWPSIVLSDAENKQASDPLVRKWLNKLQRAVDGAENLLEEVNYEALRLQVEGQHQNLVETSNQQVSDLNLSLSDDFFLNIEEKLEGTIKKLEVLKRKIGDLGLQKYFDSEQLIDCLLSNDANGKKLTVVPIVGMGGLGKTTLAKAAYNDKMLLQEIDSFDSKDDNNLNWLQAKLKEKLNGKRFLIVLDDMWNDNYERWDELRSLFVQGAAGNNRDPKEHPKLEEVGKQIADKCKGLPLALKAVAESCQTVFVILLKLLLKLKVGTEFYTRSSDETY
ncbi:hypothetical protein T459_34802, partial [Capsicum annuum]